MRDITAFIETFRKTGNYRTPPEQLGKPRRNSVWNSIVYNVRALGGSMLRGTWLSHQGRFDDHRWQECGLHLLWETERMGTEVILEGFEQLKDAGPVVVVSNHMSLYETFAFPPLMRAFGDVAIVLKESLMRVPLLGQTFATRKTIPVGRSDPRADLKAVLACGERFLREDKASVLLYPQGTRQPYFDCRKFNTFRKLEADSVVGRPNPSGSTPIYAYERRRRNYQTNATRVLPPPSAAPLPPHGRPASCLPCLCPPENKVRLSPWEPYLRRAA